MKKLAALFLAAGLLLGAAGGASAIDFKARGDWVMSFEYGANGNFMGSYNGHDQPGSHYNKGPDNFSANQRMRLQINAVASESLSGTVHFEIGQNQMWGKASQGGALGADGKIVKLKQAYIDWMVPDADVKVRMGIPHITLPSYTTGGSTILDDETAAINVTWQATENVGLSAIWMRPYNDNFEGWGGFRPDVNQANYMDNMDLFTMLVPMTFEGLKVTPWGMYGMIGPNTFRTVTQNDDGRWVNNALGWGGGDPSGRCIRGGLFPVGGARHRDFSNANNVASRKLDTYGNGWWAGLTGDVTIWDPFRVAWDLNYGSITWDDDGRLNRQGWLASLLFEYKLDWSIPGLYGWYGSGDDSNPANGSERMPTISDNNVSQFSNFAFAGDAYIARDAVISMGSMSGTWGIGARLKDMSFIEDLKTTFRINLMGGTNSPTMAKKMSLQGLWANGTTLEGWKGGSTWGRDGMYLTSLDHALEFGLHNVYKIYENLKINIEADYIAMWLDTSSSVWGARHRDGKSIPETKDAWNINCSFIYNF